MEFDSKYVSKTPDTKGFVQYDSIENQTWQTLYTRQHNIIQGRACCEYLQGLALLNLDPNAIPQLPHVNEQLYQATQWTVEPVAALISAEAFFTLLAKRQFPAATFIRTPEELNYLQEPDIFHELFGHCPLLTQPVYADFLQAYAQAVLDFDKSYWSLLQRLFWFTVEFGLIQTDQGLRAYGGGILSSIEETQYCLESRLPMRVLFDPLVAFRTPYRIDLKQTTYFVIQSYQELYDILKLDMKSLMDQACELGEFAANFPVDDNNPSVHIGYC